MTRSQESFTFTVGKLDAGMAILLGERAHLIEFPSLLLPPGTTTGSIVNISVHQNHAEEKKRDAEFWDLQKGILEKYGVRTPEPPRLELRNVTQTSVTLEWPQLQLATAKLRSLDIYRNRQRLASIPAPMTNTSTKLSGLQLDTEYTFQLVLRTTAGTFPSNVLHVRTHTMTDTSGISVCFGNVQDAVLLENAKMALREMGAKWSEKIQIDTTHFVCTTPAATPSGAQATGSVSSAPGVEYQKALQMSIPVVQPTWILACHSEKKMVPIGPYYLGASSSAPMNQAPFTRPQSMSQATLPTPSSRTTSPVATKANRQSMPPPRSAASPPTTAPAARSGSRVIEPTPEEESASETEEERAGRTRKGTMSKNFRFPSPAPEPTPPLPDIPGAKQGEGQGRASVDASRASTSTAERTVSPRTSLSAHAPEDSEEVSLAPVSAIAPSVVEVPPPPPVEKERIPATPNDIGEEEVGETEEISLN